MQYSYSKNIYDILAEYALEFVNRGHHFRKLQASRYTGCSEAAANVLFV